MKLTEKVEHFTVFESFPSTSCCSQKFPPKNLEKIGWLDVRGSISDVFIGWVGGWWGWIGRKRPVTVQNCGRALQKSTWRGCAGSLMAEMKHNLQCGRLGC